MAFDKSSKFTTYTVGPENQKPVAQLAFTKISALIGSIVQLDGRKSYDPEKQPLNYHWRFSSVPLGSSVEAAGFKHLRPRGSAVSFIPDKIGTYVVELAVDDGELTSDPVTANVSIQLCQVPVGENIVPDARFLWNYISDFWNLVEDREKITTIWSSILQEMGSELITLWDHDLNKSLATVQQVAQRRWQRIPLRSGLKNMKDQRIIVGKTDGGVNGRSGNIGQAPGTGATTVFYLPLGNPGDGDKTDFTNLNGNFGAKGRILVVNGEGHTIERVANKGLLLASGTDGATTAGTNRISSASSDFVGLGVVPGDRLVIRTGNNTGTYKVAAVATHYIDAVYLTDPPGGPVPAFETAADLGFAVGRPYSVIFLRNSTLPDGLVGAEWRLPHFLHVPGARFQARGVSAGDVLVLEVTRNDIKLSAELHATVVGSSGDRLGFEFTTDALDALTNSGSAASVVEALGAVTVTGLSGMKPSCVGGQLELLNGDSGGHSYKILRYIDPTSVVIEDPLASGADSANPNVQWVERGRQGLNVEKEIFRKLVQDLRLLPPQSTDVDIAAFADTFISFIPVGINLSQRPFGPYKFTIKAKEIIHNKSVLVDTSVVSIPALQESPADPPVILLENLDYTVENGRLTFINELFDVKNPSPREMWAEMLLYDNSDTIESNFGRLVSLRKNDLATSKTRAPYLSAVKGLIFAYANGPKVSNLRLGLQILLGLPFAEARCLILEHQTNFTTDSSGAPLGRLLVEDLDENWKRTGNRRVYFYPMSVGLETNPSTSTAYKVGDVVEEFAPISKGVDVEDYVKVPNWWERSLYGLEVMKYFVFKVLIDSTVFNSADVQFALDFIKAIKPEYVRAIATLVHTLEDDITLDDAVGGSITAKFYDNMNGLEATNRATDDNQEGVVLWNLGSRPFHTRTLRTLRDVETSVVSYMGGSAIKVTSATGWGSIYTPSTKLTSGPSLVRGRQEFAAANIVVEGDLLVIHQGQPGAGLLVPGMYEVFAVEDIHNLYVKATAPFAEQESLDYPTIELFESGENLSASIVRREAGTLLVGDDLAVVAGSYDATSASARFKSNSVMPGDTLVIEGTGPAAGEYVIADRNNTGSNANIMWAGASSTLTDIGEFTPASVGGVLQIKTGLHAGVYRITSYTGPGSIGFVSSWTDGPESGVSWQELPRGASLTEDTVTLFNQDGTWAVFEDSASGLSFRVVRPMLQRGTVFNAQSVYNGGTSKMELRCMDAGTGLSRDVFTPGMVGQLVGVSGSQNPVNDGIFMITDYIDAGKVVIDSSSTTSDIDGSSTVHLVGQA